MNTLYENLAGGIILQAVKDYRRALKTLKKHPDDSITADKKNDIERFFRSEHFAVLSNLDPEALIQRLNKEVVA